MNSSLDYAIKNERHRSNVPWVIRGCIHTHIYDNIYMHIYIYIYGTTLIGY